MRFDAWLAATTKRLAAVSVGTARLDCLILAEDVFGKDRSWLLAHPEYPLGNAAFHELDLLIARREKHEPLAYIRGKTEFYGREFIVTHDVLEPRPESETMISLLLTESIVKDQGSSNITIIDVGTGSGALAITAKLEIPQATITAVDIDPNCLAIARKNAKKHNVTITFLQGNLLEPCLPLDSCPLILLCNLPYVPDSYRINEAALHEPRLALFGGKDGLNPYRGLFKQIQRSGKRPQVIFAESLPFQHQTLARIAQDHDFIQKTEDDFIQVFTPKDN